MSHQYIKKVIPKKKPNLERLAGETIDLSKIVLELPTPKNEERFSKKISVAEIAKEIPLRELNDPFYMDTSDKEDKKSPKEISEGPRTQIIRLLGDPPFVDSDYSIDSEELKSEILDPEAAFSSGVK